MSQPHHKPNHRPANYAYSAQAALTRRTIVIVVIIVGVLVLVLGFLAVPKLLNRIDPNHNDPTPTSADPNDPNAWHPNGPQTVWLDEGYSAGFTKLLMPDLLKAVGASSDHRTVAGTRPFVDGASGIDISSGEQKWRLDKASCDSIRPARDGSLYCTGYSRPGETELMRVDISTGEKTILLTLPSDLHARSLISVGEYQGAEIVSWRQDDTVMVAALADGNVKWQTSLLDSQAVVRCHLLGSHIGCASKEQYAVADASDGHTTIAPVPLDESDWLIWATDGFAIDALPGDRSEPNTAVLYDFDGRRVGEKDDLYTPIPGWYEGFSYPLAEIQRESVPLLIDAAGNPVLTEGPTHGQMTFSSSGANVEIFTYRMASADGSVMLLAPTSDSMALYSGGGTKLWTIDWDPAWIQPIDGLIVLQRGGLMEADTVLVPSGR